MDGGDVARIVRVDFELLPQPLDRVVDGAGRGLGGIAPDFAEQLAAMDDESPPLGEIEQQIELTAAEVDRAARIVGTQVLKIDDDPAEPDADDGAPCPPEEGVQPRLELVEVERLGDVVVGAGLEAPEDVGLLIAGGQHDDGSTAAGPDETAELEPVGARQHDVEQHEIGRERARGGQHFVAAVHRFDLESRVGQVVGQDARERPIVLDHEDSLFHGA
jgi:hypothetical protein